jgi:hypothetical protein
MSGRILFDGTSPKAQSIDAVKAPNGPKTTAEKRAARYARKAREEARWQRQQQQQQNSSIAAHAEEIAAPCKAEAERMKEQAAKLPLPNGTIEGMYEARIVQALVEIMTGRRTTARPQLISMPESIYEPICLVLSSTEQFYYRVTASSCTCKGWHYSAQRFGVGKCRHHAMAFPEQAAQNAAKIEAMTAERKAQTAKKAAPAHDEDCSHRGPPKQARPPRDLTPAELEDLKGKITTALKGKYPMFHYVLGSSTFEGLTIRHDFKDDYTKEEVAQIQAMIQAAKAVCPKVEIYASGAL